MLTILRFLLLLLLGAAALADQVRVSATTTSMAMLAREIGGQHVKVTALAPSNRDVHYLQAKPSMINSLRRSDLLVAVGGELEAGWLPVAISSAANGRILPGQSGYFEAAAQVSLLGSEQSADRALGDIHPMGNPHINLDPVRMATVAAALAERLTQIDPAHASDYRTAAATFNQRIQDRLPGWLAAAAEAPGAILYHTSADYLMTLLDVHLHGYIEPFPGIPPTGRHLKQLLQNAKGQRGVIIFQDFQPDKGPKFLARELGWPVHELPIDPPLQATLEDYLTLIDSWVAALALTDQR